MHIFRQLLDALLGALAIGNLVQEKPTVYSRPERTRCPSCNQPLKVKKTTTGRTVFTMHLGGFHIHETSLYCASCDNQRIYRSEELKRMFPERCNFGYDVIVHIGRRLLLDHRPVGEVRAELVVRNVEISESEVGFLARRFVAYLVAAHRQAALRLRKAMAAKGGYILHIDATCEGGGPMLVSGIDALSATMLWNKTIPTEKAEHATAFLLEIKQLYGRPLLVVMDMSNGFEKAVRTVFGNDMRMLICHFHFLRDIGKDLLEGDYDIIRKRLRKHGICAQLRYRLRSLRAIVDEYQNLLEKLDPSTEKMESLNEEERKVMPALAAYSLIQWALEGKKVGDAYGFPFDRPLLAFAGRISEAYHQLDELKTVFGANSSKENRPIFKAVNDLRSLVEDKELSRACGALCGKIRIFDELREAMRIAPLGQGDGLNDEGDDEPIEIIECRVRQFRTSVIENGTLNQSEYQKMIEQIDKYWERLFAASIKIHTSERVITIQPQRTNNLMEHLFRDVRRSHRRKTGNNSMRVKIRTMQANSLLARNLNSQQYMEILLDGRQSLDEVFADIEAKTARKEATQNPDDTERIPRRVRKIIKREDFPSEMLANLKKIVG